MVRGEGKIEKKSSDEEKEYLRKGIPKPFLYLWLALSTLMNIGGLTSILDGVIKWVGFLERFMESYQMYIREPLHAFLEIIWLDFIVQLPPWFADYTVIVGTYMSSLILLVLFNKKDAPSILGFFVAIVSMPRFIFKFAGGRKGMGLYPRQTLLFALCILILVVLTLTVLLLAPVIHISGGLLSWLALGYWSRGEQRILDYYLLGIVVCVLLLVGINYQMQDLCLGVKTPITLCSWLL